MLPNRAKIVVIGGGVLGTSAALHLARAGHKNIVLLEAGPIGSGTTPFAAGQSGYLSVKKSAVAFSRYCIEFFENFRRETGHPIDFRQTGSLRVSVSDRYTAELKAMAELAPEFGGGVDFLTPGQAQKLIPGLTLKEAAGILHIPREGYVEPKSVAVGYAAGARDLGVKIYTHTPVTSIDVADGRIRKVQTTEGSIECEWVVLAAGAWTRKLGREFGVNIKSVPVRHQALVTAPLPDVSVQQPILRVVDQQLYIRPESGGLLIGGYGYQPETFEMDDFPDDFEIPALKADRQTRIDLQREAARYLPSVEGTPVVQDRRGLPTITPDSTFMVSELAQARGVVVATGCQVGGIYFSPGIGRLTADIISGQETFALAANLKADRFGNRWDGDGALRKRCEDVYATMYWGIRENLPAPEEKSAATA